MQYEDKAQSLPLSADLKAGMGTGLAPTTTREIPGNISVCTLHPNLV